MRCGRRGQGKRLRRSLGSNGGWHFKVCWRRRKCFLRSSPWNTAIRPGIWGHERASFIAMFSLYVDAPCWSGLAVDFTRSGTRAACGINKHINTKPEHSASMKEHRMCDDPREAGGPDVLSKSAAPSQAETKHKGADPASSHCGSPWRSASRREVQGEGGRRTARAAEGMVVANFSLPKSEDSFRVSRKMATRLK